MPRRRMPQIQKIEGQSVHVHRFTSYLHDLKVYHWAHQKKSTRPEMLSRPPIDIMAMHRHMARRDCVSPSE